jgi:hypothetical protein
VEGDLREPISDCIYTSQFSDNEVSDYLVKEDLWMENTAVSVSNSLDQLCPLKENLFNFSYPSGRMFGISISDSWALFTTPACTTAGVSSG